MRSEVDAQLVESRQLDVLIVGFILNRSEQVLELRESEANPFSYCLGTVAREEAVLAKSNEKQKSGGRQVLDLVTHHEVDGRPSIHITELDILENVVDYVTEVKSALSHFPSLISHHYFKYIFVVLNAKLVAIFTNFSIGSVSSVLSQVVMLVHISCTVGVGLSASFDSVDYFSPH